MGVEEFVVDGCALYFSPPNRSILSKNRAQTSQSTYPFGNNRQQVTINKDRVGKGHLCFGGFGAGQKAAGHVYLDQPARKACTI